MSASVADRMRARSVAVPSGCIEWIGSGSRGYGAIKIDGVTHRAHRVAWELAHGFIPAGLFVCHRCDNPRCINVEHLFLGTPADNNNDKIAKGRQAPTKTHCPRGHEYTESNSRTNPAGFHVCRVCDRARYLAHRDDRLAHLKAKRERSAA